MIYLKKCSFKLIKGKWDLSLDLRIDFSVFSKMFYSLTFENIPLIKVLVKIMIQITIVMQQQESSKNTRKKLR